MYQLTVIHQTLEEAGIHNAVIFLNRRVAHRYTGIFELVDGFFHAREIVDKLRQPFPEVFKVVPFDDSFCPVTIAENGFHTHNSMREPRLRGAAHRDVVRSYVGLSLLDTADHFYGTLCHFDFDSHRIIDEEFEYLKRVAILLPKYLPSRALDFDR